VERRLKLFIMIILKIGHESIFDFFKNIFYKVEQLNLWKAYLQQNIIILEEFWHWKAEISFRILKRYAPSHNIIKDSVYFRILRFA